MKFVIENYEFQFELSIHRVSWSYFETGDRFMVRISQIELFDFKNIGYGKIIFPKTAKSGASASGADVLGIYGQNGSGKTSVIEALQLLKTIVSGDSFDPIMVGDYFSPNKLSFTIGTQFYVECDSQNLPSASIVSYELTLSRSEEVIWISREKVAAKSADPFSDVFAKRKVLFDFSQDLPDSAPALAPKGDWRYLLNADADLKMSLLVTFGVQQKNHCSSLFSLYTFKRFRSLETCIFDLYKAELPPSGLEVDYESLAAQSLSFKKARVQTLIPLCDIFSLLYFYFSSRVRIFDTRVNAECSLSVLSMDIPDDRLLFNKAHLTVDLVKPAPFSEDDLSRISSALSRASNLIGALVPGLSLKIKEVGSQLFDDGKTVAKQVEFMSCRDGVEIPLRCESEGVRKLVSLSLALMEVHSYSDAFVAIDELDSGVFEYLLGELLSVIDSFGKGQLIFTAHNLRILELLPTSDILLTTSDPANRFVKFKGSRPTNNLRDQYLRSIALGDDSSKLYTPTDRFSIDDALCLDGD